MVKNVQVEQSIAKMVREYIEQNSIMKRCLSMGIANVSSMARLISSDLKRKGVDASVQSISSAIKRLRLSDMNEFDKPFKVLGNSNISLTTDVGKIVVNRRSLKTVTEKLSLISDDVIFFSKTVNTFTIVMNRSSYEQILNLLRKHNERPIESKLGLSLITIHSTKDIIETPGVIEIIYQTLANNSINIEDTTSSYVDTLLLVSNRDAGRAFTVLNDLVSQYGKTSHIEYG